MLGFGDADAKCECRCEWVHLYYVCSAIEHGAVTHQVRRDQGVDLSIYILYTFYIYSAGSAGECRESR